MGSDEPHRGVGAPRTRRQRIVELLSEREHGFDELCALLRIPVRQLEDDLRHVARSARRAPWRLHVSPPRCRGCGFDFKSRSERYFHTPGRCPRCRGERIEEPRFHIARSSGV